MHWKGWCGAGLDAIRVSDGRGCSAGNKLPAVPPQDFQIATAAHNRCWRALTSSRQINSRNCVAKPTGNRFLQSSVRGLHLTGELYAAGAFRVLATPNATPNAIFPVKGAGSGRPLFYYYLIINNI